MNCGVERPELMSPPKAWEKLTRFDQPALPVLAKFVHGCSENSSTRTLAVTQFLTSLWQLAGRSVSGRMPSTLVINGHDLVPDATDMLALTIIAKPTSSGPRMHREGLFLNHAPEQAPGAMIRAINTKQELGKVSPLNAKAHRDWEEFFFAAQRTGFGHGPGRRYAGAWHDEFGLITDRNDEVILRIDLPEDRAALRKDVIGGEKRLRQPLGYGAGLEIVQKHVALSGSLPVSRWDAELAGGLVDLGLPLLMLPSLAKTPPEFANPMVFNLLTASLPMSFDARIEEPANLFPDPGFEAYGRELRQRLRHLPSDYDYTMQKLARQLFPFCLHVANWCGTLSAASPNEIVALTHDLCAHAMRGLVWSVVGLAWHGFGIDAGCSRQRIVRVLEYLRERDPMTKSELRRGAHLGKEERDQILKCLVAENLVRLEGKAVVASSYVEFVQCLHSRKDLPQPENHWAAIKRKDQEAA